MIEIFDTIIWYIVSLKNVVTFGSKRKAQIKTQRKLIENSISRHYIRVAMSGMWNTMCSSCKTSDLSNNVDISFVKWMRMQALTVVLLVLRIVYWDIGQLLLQMLLNVTYSTSIGSTSIVSIIGLPLFECNS